MASNLHMREREDQVECHTCGWRYTGPRVIRVLTRPPHKRFHSAVKHHLVRHPGHEVHWRTEILRIY